MPDESTFRLQPVEASRESYPSPTDRDSASPPPATVYRSSPHPPVSVLLIHLPHVVAHLAVLRHLPCRSDVILRLGNLPSRKYTHPIVSQTAVIRLMCCRSSSAQVAKRDLRCLLLQLVHRLLVFASAVGRSALKSASSYAALFSVPGSSAPAMLFCNVSFPRRACRTATGSPRLHSDIVVIRSLLHRCLPSPCRLVIFLLQDQQ